MFRRRTLELANKVWEGGLVGFSKLVAHCVMDVLYEMSG